jgi:ankyrin repeat protein
VINESGTEREARVDDWLTTLSRLFASAIVVVAVAPAMHAQSAAQTGDKADALSEAARKGDAAAVKKLLDDGVDVNTKFRYNRTALSFAADRGHVDVVKVLVDRGADPNVKDTFYGATPLAWAVSPAMDRTPQHTEVVRLLLAHGGIPADALSDALAAATRNKLDDVVALLEKAGAKPKPK